MWDLSQLFSSFISDILKWQPRLKKVWRVFVAPPAQAFTKMQARMFNTCQAFAALKWTHPPLGMPTLTISAPHIGQVRLKDAPFLLSRSPRTAQPPRTDTVRPVDRRRVCAFL